MNRRHLLLRCTRTFFVIVAPSVVFFSCKTPAPSSIFSSLDDTSLSGCEAAASILKETPLGVLRAMEMMLRPGLRPASGIVLAAIGSDTPTGGPVTAVAQTVKTSGAPEDVHAGMLADGALSGRSERLGKDLAKDSSTTPNDLAVVADRLFDLLPELNKDEWAMAEHVVAAMDVAFDGLGDKALPYAESHILNRAIIAALMYSDAPPAAEKNAAAALEAAIKAARAFVDQAAWSKQNLPARQNHLLLALSQIHVLLLIQKPQSKTLLTKVDAMLSSVAEAAIKNTDAYLSTLIGAERAIVSLAHAGASEEDLNKAVDALVVSAKKGTQAQVDALVPAWQSVDVSRVKYAANDDARYQLFFSPDYLGSASEPIELFNERLKILPITSPSSALLNAFTPGKIPDFAATRQ